MQQWLAGAMALFLAFDVAAAPQICRFDQRERCRPGVACETVAPTTWVRLDAETRRYSRCDAKGCDDYTAIIGRSGIWITLDMPGRGMAAKLRETGQLVEMVSINDLVLVSYGTCRPE